MPILTDVTVPNERPATGNGPAREIYLLIAVLGAILAARLLGVLFSTTDFHYEEAAIWYRSLGLGPATAPPLLPWTVGLFTSLCGDGEACVRLPSPIFATAAAALVYALAARLYDRRTGLLAAIAYATLPGVSAFAMVAIPEQALAPFVAAMLLMLSVHLDRPTLASGAGLGIATGLGLLADTSMAWLPACTALYLAATPKSRHVLASPGTWLAVAIAGAMAWSSLARELLGTSTAVEVFFATGGRLLGQINPDAALVVVLLQLLLLGPIMLFVLFRSVLVRRSLFPRNPADRLLLFHSIPIFVAILVLSFFGEARAHWAMPAYPAAVVFVVAILLRHNFGRLLTISIALHVAALAVILAIGIFARQARDIPFFDRLLGWQKFGDELARAAAVSDVKTVVLRGSDQVYEALYYLRGSGLEVRAFKPRGRAPGNDAERGRTWAYGDAETVLLATGRDLSRFGIPLGAADEIGEFPVPRHLDSDGVFSLYRVNPPAEGQPAP